ncbi:pinin-like [Littorina saxatilis]|uniref:pinin-like n=1 Tax=Littorina saxatilis TaxID=31220 RepID=UPI0038B54CFE
MAEKRAANQTEEVQAGHGQEDWQPRPPFHTTPRGMLGSASSPGRGRGRGKLFDDRTVRQSGGYPAPGQAEGGFVTLSKGDGELKHHIPQFPSPQGDTSAMLLQFLQVDREERRRREQKEEEERKRREEKEAEEKEKERKFWQLMLEHETDRERARVEREEKREKARVEKEEKTIKGVKIPTLEDKDNIEEYLDQFERIAGTQGWKKETWIARLLPQLRGTARSLYFTLPTEEAGNYDQFRDALMKRFNLTAEGYRKKFRESRKEQSETFAQFVVRIKSYFKKWVCLCKKDFEKGEDLQDVILTEQLMETLSSDLVVKVKERKPANVVEAAEAADVVIEAKKGVRKPQVAPTNLNPSGGGFGCRHKRGGEQGR